MFFSRVIVVKKIRGGNFSPSLNLSPFIYGKQQLFHGFCRMQKKHLQFHPYIVAPLLHCQAQ